MGAHCSSCKDRGAGLAAWVPETPASLLHWVFLFAAAPFMTPVPDLEDLMGYDLLTETFLEGGLHNEGPSCVLVSSGAADSP